MNFSLLLQGGVLIACMGVSLYCHILARRLRKLNDLETGLGGAIAVMSAEVSRLEAAIIDARSEAAQVSQDLAEKISAAQSEKTGLESLLQGQVPPSRPRRVRRRTGLDNSADAKVASDAG